MLGIPQELPSEGRYAAGALVRRLLVEHARAHRAGYALAFMLMAVAAACTALSAYLIGEFVNRAYVDRNYRAIVIVALSAVVLFTLKGAATYGQAVILARIGNRITASNQRLLFSALLRENLAFFADRHSSEFVARLNAGSAAVSQTLSLIISACGRDALSLAGLATVMLLQDPVMSLVGLLVVPPAILVLRKLIRRAHSVAQSQFIGGARTLETLQEMLQGIRVVKAFSLEEQVERRAAANIADVEQSANTMARVSNRSSPLMETLGGFAVALAMLYGGYRVVVTGAAPGGFISFITAFLLAYEPAKRLARLNIDLAGALVGVRLLLHVTDAPPSEPDDADKPALTVTGAAVEFREVEFSYRAGEPVLCGLSFSAEPGRMTALVGPSGGGKSTVLNLLLRLYDPTGGAVLIDRQDLAGVSRNSVRRQIAYVGQDVFLFRATIGENIAFGRTGASEDEVIAAAKAAFAHDFISGFPKGYATQVGERGMQLSGGQRQRIAIARALIRQAPLILLDEATAALDSESEQQVQKAIARLCEGRTTIVIAHRLSTIQHADRICVLEEGRVVEVGRHDELVRRGGRYAAFQRLQLQTSPRDTHDPSEQVYVAPSG